MDIYLALVHHPVRNRVGDIVTTSVTNLDIHDLARSARTYDVRGYLVVTPIAEQQLLVDSVIAHWTTGSGRTTNPDRAEAFSRVSVAPSLSAGIETIATRHGARPWVLGTSAQKTQVTVSFASARERLSKPPGAALIVLGTGWGLAPDALMQCDAMLDPVDALPARAGYNHLPVRAAAAIILDRLLGDR